MIKPERSAKQLWVFIACAEVITLGSTIWGTSKGVAVGALLPGALIGGAASGAGLYILTKAAKTGFMQRGEMLYRFRDRPITYMMDALLWSAAILLGLAWTAGMTLQILARE